MAGQGPWANKVGSHISLVVMSFLGTDSRGAAGDTAGSGAPAVQHEARVHTDMSKGEKPYSKNWNITF